jgi:hypothetical protein
MVLPVVFCHISEDIERKKIRINTSPLQELKSNANIVPVPYMEANAMILKYILCLTVISGTVRYRKDPDQKAIMQPGKLLILIHIKYLLRKRKYL